MIAKEGSRLTLQLISQLFTRLEEGGSLWLNLDLSARFGISSLISFIPSDLKGAKASQLDSIACDQGVLDR